MRHDMRLVYLYYIFFIGMQFSKSQICGFYSNDTVACLQNPHITCLTHYDLCLNVYLDYHAFYVVWEFLSLPIEDPDCHDVII